MNDKCDRCQGLLVEIIFYDKQDSCISQKCVNCGDVTDWVIRNARFRNNEALRKTQTPQRQGWACGQKQKAG